jgi:hypothetical protein
MPKIYSLHVYFKSSKLLLKGESFSVISRCMNREHSTELKHIHVEVGEFLYFLICNGSLISAIFSKLKLSRAIPAKDA